MESPVLEPYERLIPVIINGRVYEVPENNTLLRVLQHMRLELAYTKYCWNGDCRTCEVRVVGAGGESAALACGTEARDGLHLAGPPAGVHLPQPDAVVAWDDIDDQGRVRSGGDRDRP